jgi:outer membrane immunogenic protein
MIDGPIKEVSPRCRVSPPIWGVEMHRHIIAGAALALAFAISPAFAADMPTKAPAMIPPPAPQWTGFNVGLSLGGRWGEIDGRSLSFGGGPLPFPALANQTYDNSTFRVGGYLGYDWQFNPNWLVGVEGDFAWGNGHKRVEALQGIAIANTGNFSEFKHTWDAGLRARLGYLITPTWLLYATGGVQWQHVEATVNCAANTCGIGLLGGFPPGAPYLQTNDTTRAGWAIGGGVETMLPGKWLLRGEYRYADFGTWQTAFGGTPIIVKEFDIVTHTAYFGVAKKF